MHIEFTKMQGLGNDFIIVDFEDYKKLVDLIPDFVKKICDRRFGVGADGVIFVNFLPSNTDIGWFFYNSDGTPAQMCGNGMRCFSKYVYEKGYINKKSFKVETLAGTIIPEIIDENIVKVNMANPILEPKKIPVEAKNNLNIEVELWSKKFLLNAVSMGNPHCVVFSDENTEQLARDYGVDIENFEIFPQKTNVEFVKIISRNEIKLDVWERGCGITLACGTGACASVVAGILNNLLDNKVKVNLPGGNLLIEWEGSKENPYKDVYMTGRADYSFSGIYEYK